ncbi:hypothetical protein H0H93_003064, partial [Arthromyces matolae]
DNESTAVTDAVCVVVSEVSDNKLYTGPLGNYNPEFNKLAGAKYQLTLGCPTEGLFAADFKDALVNIRQLQDKTAIGSDCRYFLVREDGAKKDPDALRMSSLIAEQRPVHLEQGGMVLYFVLHD